MEKSSCGLGNPDTYSYKPLPRTILQDSMKHTDLLRVYNSLFASLCRQLILGNRGLSSSLFILNTCAHAHKYTHKCDR